MNSPYIMTAINTIIGLVIGVLFSAMKNYYRKEKKEKKDVELLKAGICSLQRQTLLSECEKHITKGFCPQDTKNVLNDLYKSYSDLGGNGLITQLVTRVNNLPASKKK